MTGFPAPALFSDPTLSEPAVYVRPGLDPVATRAVRSIASADFRFDGATIRSDATTLKVPAADVPAPADGDLFVVGGVLEVVGTVPEAPAPGEPYAIRYRATGAVLRVQGVPARIARGVAWHVEAVADRVDEELWFAGATIEPEPAP
jgi:hypothetical protein